jgi:hypothetical protein
VPQSVISRVHQCPDLSAATIRDLVLAVKTDGRF